MNARQLAAVQRTFVPPRPLKLSRPRSVELTATGQFLVVMAVGLFAGSIAAGLVLHREAARQAETRRALVTTGVMTTGEVTQLWSKDDDDDDDDDDRRRVAYRFAANGQTYTGRVRVSEERRRSLVVGSPFPIRYVPADPRIHDRGGTPPGGLPQWLPFPFAAGMVTLGGLCLWATHRQRRLLSEGRVVPAVVTGHRSQHTSHGGKHRSMTFEFPLLNGSVRTGASGTSDKPPAVGSVICVVYDPERPARHQVYPFSLVRPTT
jgi:hypothetical protein